MGIERRRLALAIEGAVENVRLARAMRVRQATVAPDRRDWLIAAVRASWSRNRTLGAVLTAMSPARTPTQLGDTTLAVGAVPKAPLVGEAKAGDVTWGWEVDLESHAEQLGRQAAAAETAHIVELLGEAGRSNSAEQTDAADPRPLVARVIATIRLMRAADYCPSLVLTPDAHHIWSRIAVDTAEDEQDRLRRAGLEHVARLVRGRVERAVVVSVPGLASGFVIDTGKALAIAADIDGRGNDLCVAITERDPVQLEAELFGDGRHVSNERSADILDEQLQQVEVRASATLPALADPGGAMLVRI